MASTTEEIEDPGQEKDQTSPFGLSKYKLLQYCQAKNTGNHCIYCSNNSETSNGRKTHVVKEATGRSKMFQL